MNTPFSTGQQGNIDGAWSSKRVLLRIWLWFGVYLLVLVNWLFGGLGFSYIPLNYFLFIAVLLIPITSWSWL